MSTIAPLVRGVALVCSIGLASGAALSAQTAPRPSPETNAALRPLKLRATVVSSHEVDLTWRERSTDELGFEIERRIGSAPFTLIATLPPDTTSWRDSAAIPSTRHAWRARMLTPGGPAPWSNVETAVTPANQLPVITCSLSQGFELRTTSVVPPRPDAFTVTASDPDGDPVSITLLNPPPGFVFVPNRDAASPATMTVSWPRTGPIVFSGGTRHLLFEAHDAVEPDRRVRFVQRIVFVDSFYSTLQSVPGGLLTADVTGDGRLDVIGTAFRADVGGIVDAGALYVWAGSDSPSGDPIATLTIPASFGSAWIGHVAPAGVFLEDVTGDGILDVIAASTRANVNGLADAGAAFVWEGGAALSGAVAPRATLVSPTPAQDHRIGERPGAMFVDLDADGVLDVFVGSMYDEDSHGGAGELYYWKGGSTLTGTPAPAATLQGLRSQRKWPDDSLVSRHVEFVDVTADGALDVVAVCSGEDLVNQDCGAIRVWDGTLLSGSMGPTATLYVPGARDDDVLGQSMYDVPLFADVTGDGMVDVIASAAQADNAWALDAGGVYVWAGGPGIVGSVVPAATLERSFKQKNDFLGESIAVADVSGDGILDVLAGSTRVDFGTTVDCGALLVFLGGAALSGIVEPRARLFGPAAGDQLELSSLVDLDGDGILDIVMGSRWATVAGVAAAGFGAIWRGGANLQGLPPPDATLSVTNPTLNDELLLLRRFVDLDGDGLLDVVGTSRWGQANNDEGAIWLFPGSSGWSGTVHESATLTESGGPIGREDNYGGEKVQFGDVTGDGQVDVIALADGATRDGLVDVGALYVFAGGSALNGAVTSTASLEALDRRKNDWLGATGGYALQLAELNGDGILDVVTASFSISRSGIQNCGAAYAWFGGPSLSGSVVSSACFTVSNATKDDELTTGHFDNMQGYFFADVTGDGALDFLTRTIRTDWLGVVDVGAFRLWKAPFQQDVDPDATLAVPNAAAGDRLGE